MRTRWNQLGGQAGIGIAVVGFFLIFLGWNGAASYDRVPSQFPYLISGGIAGLALVVLGAALMVTQALREDRAEVVEEMRQLRQAVERGAGAGTTTADGSLSPAVLRQAESSGLVVAGPSSYHRPSCRLLSGRGRHPTVTVEEAEDRGLSACRVCDPAVLPATPTL